MKNYIHEHKKNIIKKQNISVSRISIGQIITFRYSESANNKNPTVLVLNNNHNNMLHGLVIDYMEIKQLNYLKDYVLREVKEVDPDSNVGFQVSLRKLSIDNPNTFYDNKLKYFLKNNIKTNIYRTYDLNKIVNTKLVRYKF